MTIGQIVESVMGKIHCQTGVICDGTPFRDMDLRRGIPEALRRLGMTGKERMYNGKTGEPIEETTFIGVTYYQRLKHMVADKMHARTKGPTQIKTRQPMEGRSRLGGLRFGEMERDNLITQGMTGTLLDRLMHQSDCFETPLCEACGLFAEPEAPAVYKATAPLHGTPYCRTCGTGEHVVRIELPYAMKLLTQELQAVHVCPRFITGEQRA